MHKLMPTGWVLVAIGSVLVIATAVPLVILFQPDSGYGPGQQQGRKTTKFLGAFLALVVFFVYWPIAQKFARKMGYEVWKGDRFRAKPK